jgi:formate dehydrogenase subunit delta
MHIDALARMANQIGGFFDAMPDRDEALQGIALHIKKFWEPRMRRELLAHLDSGDASTLSPSVVEAMQRHRELLAPVERA